MDKDSLHVTVCVPAHNAGWSLARTMDSILAQDYPDIDVFVCDNCSSDNTAEIAKSYENRGVRYFFNPVISGGAEGNWNYALTLAKGPMIAVYHADDLYNPGIVRKQVEFFKSNPGVSSVFTMTQLIDEKDRPVKKGSTSLPIELRKKNVFNFEELINAVLEYTNFMIVPSMMTKKEVLEKVGNFNWPEFKSAADIDLYLRMSQTGPIGIIDEPLHQYRISTHQDSNVIHNSRTHLAHFFWVMDYWLELPEISQSIKPSARRVYDMYRASDQVLCAMKMLVQNKPQDAKGLLLQAMKTSNWMTGLSFQPRRVPYFLAGLFLLMSTMAGFGTFSGKLTNALYQKYLWHMRQPVRTIDDK